MSAQNTESNGDPVVVSIRDLLVERVDPLSGKVFRLQVPALDIRRGARMCLIGKSGSGKTTLLELLGLLVHPTQLERFDLSPYGDGRMMPLIAPLMKPDVNTLSAIRARTMGFVLQDGGLLPYLTIRENAQLAAELAGHPRGGETDERIAEIAQLIGIGGLLDRLPAKMSGGERQRAAVLRGLAPRPQVLLVDEPTASLDPQTSEEVLGLLVHSAQTFGATVIMVSHNAPLARQFGFDLHPLETTETKTEKTSVLHADQLEAAQ